MIIGAFSYRIIFMPEKEVILRTDKLSKKFSGIVAVDSIDLQLSPGDIFGLIGPNGSGKTTLIKMLTTLLKPTSGSAYIYGYDIFKEPAKVRGIIGYMPDYFGVYDDLKVYEYLDFFAAAYKIPKSVRKKVIEDAIELTDLDVRRKSFIRELSAGMKQRLCLAKTILHDPEVLLLDEPAANLDPLARSEIKEILKELGSMGKTILVTSNIIPELSDYCNKVGIIKEGRLVFCGDIKDNELNLEDLFLKSIGGESHG
jgi:ABC-2 type transport system ATP-binding protein